MSTTENVTSLEARKVDLKRTLDNGTNVKNLLDAYQKAFAHAAPKHLDVNRFLRIVLNDVSRNKDLLKCSGQSLFVAVMTAVQLGLEIGVMGQAYLVPYYNSKQRRFEAQLIPGYRGLVQLARNSGQVSTIWANVVYRQDKFRYIDGLERILEHEPVDDHDELDDDIIAAYAVCKFKDGGFQLDVMRRHRIDKIRARSKSPDKGPWITDFAEMAKKTVIRRLSKMLPISIEMTMAVKLDERGAMGVPQNINLIEQGENLPPLIDVNDNDDPETDEREREPAKGTLDIHEFKAGRAENRGHDAEHLDQANAPPNLEKQLADSIAMQRCDVGDFIELETLATDCGVKLSEVADHVTATMGFKEYSQLTKNRKGEVTSWIKAKSRK